MRVRASKIETAAIILGIALCIVAVWGAMGTALWYMTGAATYFWRIVNG